MISFFLVPFYTQALTTAEYGVADLFTTICTLLVPIVTLNISEGIMRFALDRNADHYKIMSIGIMCGVGSGLLLAVTVPFLQGLFKLESYGSLLFLYCCSFALSQIFMSYLRGTEKLLMFAYGNILQASLIAGLNILFLLNFKWGLRGYFLSFSISYLIVMLYAILAGQAYKVFAHFKFDAKLFISMSKYAVALIPNSLMWWVTNSSDRVMIAGILGAAANGIYAVSYKIPTLLSTFSTIFSQAWSYSAISEKDSMDQEQLTNDVYKTLFSALIIAAAALLIIIRPFMSYYVAANYFVAWKYCPALIIGFLYMSLGSFVATPYVVHKDSLHMMLSGVTGAGVNIVLNLILIPRLGIQGAAIATCVSYIAIYLFRMMDTQRYVKLKAFPNKTLVASLLMWVLMGFVYIENIVGIVVQLLIFCAILLCLKDIWIPIFKVVIRRVAKQKNK